MSRPASSPAASTSPAPPWPRSATHEDDLRRALVLEPRGHDAVIVAYLTDPVTEDADRGVVFVNDAGYLGMCGHGTIGVATVLVRLGMVEVHEPVTTIRLDTPVGRVTADVRVESSRPRSVSFRNVPSYVQEFGRTVEVEGLGEITMDISWGGNWFAFVPASQVGLSVEPKNLDELMVTAKRIRRAIRDQGIVGVDPETGETEPIEHVKIYTEQPDPAGVLSRALTLCPGNAYDRSPCGTGSSAKLAVLAQRENWEDGHVFRSQSVLGTEFRAHVADRTEVGGRRAVIPQIEGSAYITGIQRFVIDPDDPLRFGL